MSADGHFDHLHQVDCSQLINYATPKNSSKLTLISKPEVLTEANQPMLLCIGEESTSTTT